MYNEKLLALKIIDKKYKPVSKRMLTLSFPILSQSELDKAIDYSICKRIKNHDCDINNNYKNTTFNTSLLETAEYIETNTPILSAHGVMFEQHTNTPTPLYNVIEGFIQNRNKFKKEMFKYPKGSDEFKKYNLLQLLAKLDCNALYGVIGMYSSLLYNIYIAASTTCQGRACISASILFFESFLSNNVKFGSLNEVIVFIDNIVEEDRVYNDAIVLDDNVDLDEAFYKIMATCGFEWTPTDSEMQIVWDILSRLTQTDLNRLYYKNNLFSFCDNKIIENMIKLILSNLKHPFLDPNHPPDEIKVELDEFLKIIKEYVYYGYQFIDKLDRVEMMNRDVSILSDTDSTIVSFDSWYNYVLSKVVDLPMTIRTEVIDPIEYLKADESGNYALLNVIERIEPEYDYDFFKDDIVSIEHMEHPYCVIPQDAVRHSIINIMGYCCSKLILDYMERLSKNYNSYSDNRKCLLIMKNEFLFKRVLLTNGKKNYAAKQEVQEGNIIPEKESLDIKGLPINKSTLQEKTRNRLKQILYDDILNSDNVHQIKILKDLATAEKEIYYSISAGKKEYYKPATIKSIISYENPMRIQGIKGAIVYNKLREDGAEAIDLEKRNGIDIVKTNIDYTSIDKIRVEYPDIHEKIMALLKMSDFANGITSIAIPLDADVPKWVLNFVDYTTIINDNIKNFPLDSIGLCRMDIESVNHTNIIKL